MADAIKLRMSEVPRPAIRVRRPGLYADNVIEAVSDQDRVFANAFAALEQAINARAFPGASIAVTDAGRLVALKAFGRFTYDPASPQVSPHTIFDLASVTKVVATTTMAMILYERGLLDLEAPVAGILPEFISDDAQRREVTFRMLLAHSSGLPAYEKLFLRASTKEALLDEAFKVPLKYPPDTHAEYSDVGFILLGVSLERIAGEPINEFCQREIFGPLGMSRTSFNPPSTSRVEIPPTADDKTFRKRIIQGEVFDENASVLGGIAPHAGLFSTSGDVTLFAQCMLAGGAPILRAETVALFAQRQSRPEGTSRALGWYTPSSPSKSGKHF